MLGWFSDEIARASRSKRALNCSRVVLMATARPNRVSIARKTSPIPPSPSLLSMRYGPRQAPEANLGDSRILQQFRRVLDGGPIQEFAAAALCEQRLYFAAQFGIGLGQQRRALLRRFPREPHGIALQFAGTAPGSCWNLAWVILILSASTPAIAKPWRDPSRA